MTEDGTAPKIIFLVVPGSMIDLCQRRLFRYSSVLALVTSASTLLITFIVPSFVDNFAFVFVVFPVITFIKVFDRV